MPRPAASAKELVRVQGQGRDWTVRWPGGRTALVTIGADLAGVTCEAEVTPVRGQSSVLFTVTARNDTPDAITVRDLDLLSCQQFTLGEYAEPIVYVDSGSQGGTHMAPLGDGQTCAGICALHNPKSNLSLLCAFVAFEHDNLVRVEPAGQGVFVRATTTTPVTIAPGESHQYDPVLLDLRRSPLEALEEYASIVKAVVNPPIPDEMPMGWLSWYAYRLTMTEDLVLANADVVARHFRRYGVSMIHPDHGWQYQDICGHWVPNEKFGHGMKWLQKQCARRGMTLGLWVAPSTISEWAPFFKEHPEGLIADAEGSPIATREEWTWAPHGKTYELDPLTRAGAKYLRDFGKLMRSYGVVYLKTDFIGGWGGARRLRSGMQIMREAVGPDITLRPCSTALNTQLGMCNEIGVARDIGNAQGLWEHLQVTSLETASKWFMHGKFWHNNPDVLIVGDEGETLGEAQGRVTLLALTGGVVFLGDRMPELEQQPERLALCSLVLPSSGQPARPIDLFWPGREYPRLWQLSAKPKWGQWEVLGLFNWSDQPLVETLRRRDLNLPAGSYLVWDFWAQKLLGRLRSELEVPVESGSARCLRVMPVPDHPAVLSTDMHVTQGLVELERVKWNEEQRELTGEAVRAPGERGAIFIYVPKDFRLAAGSSEAEMVAPGVAKLTVSFNQARRKWSVRFE